MKLFGTYLHYFMVSINKLYILKSQLCLEMIRAITFQPIKIVLPLCSKLLYIKALQFILYHKFISYDSGHKNKL